MVIRRIRIAETGVRFSLGPPTMLKLFGINIADLSLVETLARLNELRLSGGQHLVVTANPEILLEARRHPEYRQVVAGASLVLADGVGVILASYLMGQPIIKGRVTGVDLVEAIVKDSGKQRYSVFLAGSTEDILNKTTQYFSSKYSNINIVGRYSGLKIKKYETGVSDGETNDLIKKINEVKPDVLLLAFGHPKQELWLVDHLKELSVKIGMGVGGTFDYLSGSTPWAPRWLRIIGLEWLFRLINEPLRFSRIVDATIVFPAYVLLGIIKKLFHMEQ